MRVLCVAEKPSIAKNITQILAGGRYETRQSGNQYVRNYDFAYRLPPPLGGAGDADFTVTAVLGHLTSTDFGEDHKRWTACDPFALFDAPILTFVASDLRAVERNLINEARRADLLMIWTDCDREGEHIGSEVASACKKGNPRIVVSRARFSAIIPAQIHAACRGAGALDMKQADAVAARIDLDLRIGAAFSRLTTLGLQQRIPELNGQVISYGPCQFPTLGFVVDQWKKVQTFTPEPFWYIYVAIEREGDEHEDDSTVVFKWRRNHLFDMEAAVILYEMCVEDPEATVLKVETKPTSKWKPLPLTTVELQQSGSRLLRMTPKKVLDVAEKLYQRGFLSYPRTETDQYDKAFDFQSLIQKQTHNQTWGQYAQTLLDGAFERPRNGRKNDKAHPPIHPTAHAGEFQSDDERRVYELVTRRFLASCSSNAQGNSTTVEISIAEELFSASGLVVTQRNYLEVYPYDKWASSALPNFQEGEKFTPTTTELKESSTSAPSLLTEADLVGLMDKNGIGTDATIAEHIAKVIDRGYVTANEEQRIKYLVPSTLGIGLVEGFDKIGFDKSLSKPQLRAETEERMVMICDGVRGKQEVLNYTIDQYKEVFVKAKREFHTVVESVNDYLHGQGEVQQALRAAVTRARGGRGPRGGRGARRGGRGGAAEPIPRDDDGDDDGHDGGGPPPAGGAVRNTRGRGSRGQAKTTRGGNSTRARGGTRISQASVIPDLRDEEPPPKRRQVDHGDPSRSPYFTETGVSRQCSCGETAVLRKVMKTDSPHQGRQFYTCSKSKDAQCGYFEWTDEAAGPSAPRPVPAPRVMPAPREHGSAFLRARSGSSDSRRCECGLEAIMLTVNKDGPNKGRRFWSCPSNPRARCQYLEWDDEPSGGDHPPRAENGAGPSRAVGGGQPGECFKCGQPGHWSSACPSNEGAGQGGPHARERNRGSAPAGECFKCGRSGHWSNACPNETSANGGKRAPAKRGRGEKKAAGSRGGGGKGSGECYRCHEKGHWASDCPNAQ